jgi:two-component system chemotaxis sensor kinase CheA
MTDPMQDIRASFFAECDELLEVLQDGLEAMEAGARDAETVNTVFRAVHSIKGGAGAFRLDDLIAFAHVFETALDALRAGRMAIGTEEMRLLFAGGDLLLDLAHAARGNRPPDMARVAALTAALNRLGNVPAWPKADLAPEFTPVPLTLDLDPHPDGATGPARDDGPNLSRTVTLVFRPEPQLYETGNEPAFLLRALSELGILTADCVHDPLPDLDVFDPSAALIGWTLRLETRASDDDIRDVFGFVEDLCSLRVDGGPSDGGATPSPPPSNDCPSRAACPADAAARPPPPMPDCPASSVLPHRPGTRAAAQLPETDGPVTRATVRVDLDRIDRLVNLAGKLAINRAMLSQAVSDAGASIDADIAMGLDEFRHLTRDIQESVMMIRAQPVKPLFQRMSRIVREASAASGKDVHLQTDGDATEIDKTVIDRLAAPLTHLIRNAVDHGIEAPEDRISAGKSAKGRIILSASHRSDRLVIEIRDDGRGIDRPAVRRVAEARGLISPGQALLDADIDVLLFIPGLSTAPAVSCLSGRGVGMDVVRRAITSLGGRIAITSHPGRGTAFTLSLPLTLAVLDGMVVRVAGQTLVVPRCAIAETLSLAPGAVRTLAPGVQMFDLRGQLFPLRDIGVALGHRAPQPTPHGATLLLLEIEDGSRVALVVDAIEDRRQVVITGFPDSHAQANGTTAATVLDDGRIAQILDPADLVAAADRHGGPARHCRLTA